MAINYGNMSTEFKMQCLARHVISECRNSAQMEKWFGRWEKKHGKTARAELRGYVVAEVDKRKAMRDQERAKQFGSVTDSSADPSTEPVDQPLNLDLFGAKIQAMGESEKEKAA